jgi:hypothetical protein
VLSAEYAWNRICWIFCTFTGLAAHTTQSPPLITKPNHNTSRFFLVLIILLGLSFSSGYYAQTGGMKRESGMKRRSSFSFKRTHSKGHADRFARAKGRRSAWARLFRKDHPAWSNRVTGNPKKNWRENKFLFSRKRSQGRIDNQTYLDKQNSRRDRKRVHGNSRFSKKKY